MPSLRFAQQAAPGSTDGSAVGPDPGCVEVEPPPLVATPIRTGFATSSGGTETAGWEPSAEAEVPALVAGSVVVTEVRMGADRVGSPTPIFGRRKRKVSKCPFESAL